MVVRAVTGLGIAVLSFALLCLAFQVDEARATAGRGVRHIARAWWRQDGRSALSVAVALLVGAALVGAGVAASMGAFGAGRDGTDLVRLAGAAGTGGDGDPVPGDPAGGARRTGSEPAGGATGADPADVPPDRSTASDDPAGDDRGGLSEPAVALDAAPGTGAPHEVAVALSRQRPAGAAGGHVVLMTEQPSGDAPVAVALAAVLDGPVLLTGREALAPATAAEVARLARPVVHLLGGDRALAWTVGDELAGAGHDVQRFAGATAVDTAVDVAARLFADADTAVLVPAFSAGDGDDRLARALVGGALAGALRAPLLVSEGAVLSSSTAAHLQTSAVRTVVVVGDEASIDEAVVEQLAALDLTVSRVGGGDAIATAAAVAAADPFTDAEGDAVLLAEGTSSAMWPGAVLAAARAGQERAPLLLSAGERLPAPTVAALRARRGDRVVCMPGVHEAACAAAGDAVAPGGTGAPAGDGRD